MAEDNLFDQVRDHERRITDTEGTLEGRSKWEPGLRETVQALHLEIVRIKWKVTLLLVLIALLLALVLGLSVVLSLNLHIGTSTFGWSA